MKLKRLAAILLALVLCLGMIPTASAASPAVRAANALYTLGLFEGVGQHTDGSPIYALDRPLTRQEAVVLLVRLLGQEQTALTAAHVQPFTDVADWAKPYVALAYATGLVQGVDAVTLNANAPVGERDYLTMLLRAMGYTDVDYRDPWTLAASVGLSDGSHAAGFTRASAVTLSFEALGLSLAGETRTLLAALYEADAVTAQEIRDAGMEAALTRRALNAEEISARCSDAVFYLECYKDELALARGDIQGNASGFFIRGDGVAVTNNHAICEARIAYAILLDGTCYRVSTVLFDDPERDIAVIRLDPTIIGVEGVIDHEAHGTTSSFPYLPIRDAEDVKNGQQVYAIGAPLGLINSISDGIVANRSRMVPSTKSPAPYIQITAAISPGSSGGALLNAYGEAIGITSATFVNGQNLNLAVRLDPLMQLDLAAEGESYLDFYGVETSRFALAVHYDRYPGVLDFGALVGAPLLQEVATERGWMYLYSVDDADDSALSEYYSGMYEWGFQYKYDMDEECLIFTDKERGLQVLGYETAWEDNAYFAIEILTIEAE